MVFKLFLDANVCIDFLLQRKGYESSERVFEKIVSSECKAYTSPAIVHIVAYFLRKVYPLDTVKLTILNLLANVRIIDCSHETAIVAVNSQMTDIEDALQYFTAMEHKMDCFISLDRDLIKASLPSLPVLTPEEFLKTYD
jgi:predicted nucleic acid-binding protein